jgi:hypothetical protein
MLLTNHQGRQNEVQPVARRAERSPLQRTVLRSVRPLRRDPPELGDLIGGVVGGQLGGGQGNLYAQHFIAGSRSRMVRAWLMHATPSRTTFRKSGKRSSGRSFRHLLC